MMEFEKNSVIIGTYDHNEHVVLKLLVKKEATGFGSYETIQSDGAKAYRERGWVSGKVSSVEMIIDWREF